MAQFPPFTLLLDRRKKRECAESRRGTGRLAAFDQCATRSPRGSARREALSAQRTKSGTQRNGPAGAPLRGRNILCWRGAAERRETAAQQPRTATERRHDRLAFQADRV